MLSEIIDYIIVLFHIGFLLFMALGPTFSNNYTIFLHMVTIPFLMLHWVLDNKTCAIVIMEKTTRKILGYSSESKDCVSARLIYPAYELPKNYPRYAKSIYFIAISLMIISGIMLYSRYEQGFIPKWEYLFNINP
jgi:hypothetical protein